MHTYPIVAAGLCADTRARQAATAQCCLLAAVRMGSKMGMRRMSTAAAPTPAQDVLSVRFCSLGALGLVCAMAGLLGQLLQPSRQADLHKRSRVYSSRAVPERLSQRQASRNALTNSWKAGCPTLVQFRL